ncbi:SDR family oxidoreductase, partial [candidate division KSB3 bacterium]|nr:SDR family oxidoreductase [candidate division KSB3 bacterium]MBD3327268.1 SDR family oxidoreductase [candidate division KSB3 bacterium]
LRVYEEGGRFLITNVPVVLNFADVEALSKRCGDAPIVPADATKDGDMQRLFHQAGDHFGTIDFIVHSIGRSENIRKRASYEDLRYSWYLKTLEASAISLHRAIHAALPVLNDGASIVAMTYIGAERIFSRYNDMGDAKSLLQSIARNFGARLGDRGIRVNTVSQSPTRTSAASGIRGFDALYEFAERLSPLGNATAEECADYVVTLLSDLTRKVTLQNLYHDGGFSQMGMNEQVIALIECDTPPSPSDTSA